jgi:hypothetical protein
MLSSVALELTMPRIDVTESPKRSTTRGADPKSACHDQDRATPRF